MQRISLQTISNESPNNIHREHHHPHRDTIYSTKINLKIQEELTLKEQQWIRYYNSVELGYNETDAIYKSGGNTYKRKTPKEMEEIKEKIRQTKLGGKNPKARKIKRTNILTNEVDIFDTIIESAKASGIQNGKTSIVQRLNGKTKSPFKGKWIYEYCD